MNSSFLDKQKGPCPIDGTEAISAKSAIAGELHHL
jgi:hypothetical protein